jgi:hypothetical protein
MSAMTVMVLSFRSSHQSRPDGTDRKRVEHGFGAHIHAEA